MPRYFACFLLTMIIASISFSQTTERKLEQTKNNPNTIENAAKADVRSVNLKKVADSSFVRQDSIKIPGKILKPKRKITSGRNKSK